MSQTLISLPVGTKTVILDLTKGPGPLADALEIIRQGGNPQQIATAMAVAQQLLPLMREGIIIYCLVALDTTGSMMDNLPRVTARLAELLEKIASCRQPKTRLLFSLALFKDLTERQPMTLAPVWMEPPAFIDGLSALRGWGGGELTCESALEAVMALPGEPSALAHRDWFTGPARSPVLPPLSLNSARVLLVCTDEMAWELNYTREQVRTTLTAHQFRVGVAANLKNPTHLAFWQGFCQPGDILVDVAGDLRGLDQLFALVIPQAVEAILVQAAASVQALLPAPSVVRL